MFNDGITLWLMSLHQSTLSRRAGLMGLSAAIACLGLSVSCVHARQVPSQASPSGAPAATMQAVPPQPRALPTTDLPIMKLDDVRIGMKGYGLSVFNGTKIETFDVEVISVQRDFAPNRGVVWVRCTDERMQKSGPVHGMSGSPIFLWPLGEEKQAGQGGSVIGAFAFGYQMVTECYVGIQPIEYMLETAGRVEATPTAFASAATAPGQPALASRMIHTLLASAKQQGATPRQTWQATMLAQAVDPLAKLQGQHLTDGSTTADLPPVTPELLAHGHGQITRLMVPLSVSSPAVAQLMTGILEPFGLRPLAGTGSVIGSRPPVEVDPDAVTFAPGSVLSVPLAWGDADLSAAGTVTALTTEGDVMGFGHAMFGDGRAALPMATGYVHMVMPTLVSSFKLGGSLQLKGALLRDEQAAVVGSAKGTYNTSPVHVRVNMPGHDQREYKYQVTHHQSLTPVLSAIVAMQSVSAVQNPPALNTLHVQGTLRFNDQQQVDINTLIPMASPVAVAMQILPPLAVMANNPFESRQIESVDITATYQPQVLVSSLARGHLTQPVVAPGDEVTINLWLQPYGGQMYRKQVSIKVPDALPDGDYQLIVGNGQTHTSMMMGTRPHLSSPTSIDALFNLVKRVMETDTTSIYVILQSHEQGLAVGQQEMPRLPSSRRALLTGSASSKTAPYQEWLSQKFETGHVIDGVLSFNLQVRKSRDLSQTNP